MSELEAWSDKLNAMTTEEIRELMVVEKVKGKRDSTSRCVLSEFLTIKVGERVTVDGIRFETDSEQHDNMQSVYEFVEYFDDGCYPELVADE